MTRFLRMITTSVAVAAAVLGTVSVAAPAYADAEECIGYITSQGTAVDGKINEACKTGETGDIIRCQTMLVEAGLLAEVPILACQKAFA